MNDILLDTHVWLWHLTDSPKLSGSIREALMHADQPPWLSPLSVWELSVLVRKGRFKLEGSFEAFVRDSFEAFPVRKAPFDFAVAERADAIDLPHRDPVDRFLAATALVHKLRLLTADRHLIKAEWLNTLA